MEYNFGCKNVILIFDRFPSFGNKKKNRAKMIMGNTRESQYLLRYRHKRLFIGSIDFFRFSQKVPNKKVISTY
jgi:hypothetical protein